jgi:hypothetical protein
MSTVAGHDPLGATPGAYPLLPLLRLALGGVFAWAAGAKLFWSGAFGQALQALGFFPAGAIVPLQLAVPMGEAVIALALVAGVAPTTTALIALFISATFVGMHGMAYYDGVFVPCGCLGLGFKPEAGGSFIWMLLLSVLMTLASATLVWITPPGGAAPRRHEPPGCGQPGSDH